MARPKMGGERREQILSAFERCVTRDGLAKTSLQNVAKASGLPRSLVRYFVGNREDMVDLLIERMVGRAEQSLLLIRPEAESTTTDAMLDFLFDGVFSDETSNAVVAELWYLAERDDKIKARLAALYSRVCDIIVSQLKQDGIGRAAAGRRNLAHSLVCLAYGAASFNSLGLNPGRTRQSRVMADVLIQSEQNQ